MNDDTKMEGVGDEEDEGEVEEEDLDEPRGSVDEDDPETTAAAGAMMMDGQKSSTTTLPPRKKKPRKRNPLPGSSGSGTAESTAAGAAATSGGKQPASDTAAGAARKKAPRKRTPASGGGSNKDPSLSSAQQAVHDQMRRALEEDQYSVVGSIVAELSEDDEDDGPDRPSTTSAHLYTYRSRQTNTTNAVPTMTVRLDRAALLQAVRKMKRLDEEEAAGNTSSGAGGGGNAEGTTLTTTGSSGTAAASTGASASTSGGGKKGPQNKKRKEDGRNVTIQEPAKKKALDTTTTTTTTASQQQQQQSSSSTTDPLLEDDDFDRDGGSIFGQTTGSSNSTWVECDKCKKWRRLRGVVDEKKLPSKWYCSMNKNDPERNRCSAPEEEYETTHTPESAADARVRKHLRVWVRRLQCNEAYEARQPTLTRGKKRAAASSSKEPYEWIRCCNPSCGKWRALLRIMDAKSSVLDRTNAEGEWYCVMNTWDEKVASCAAPQENLPAVGCPSWVMQDDE